MTLRSPETEALLEEADASLLDLVDNVLTKIGDPTFVGHGVLISNTYSGTASLQGVTLNGTNLFSNNDSAGLEINTYGAVLLNAITATANGFSDPGRHEGVYIENSLGTSPAAVTITGNNLFSSNKATGLVPAITVG